LETHLIVDAGGAGEGAVVFAAEAEVEQAASFRQILVGGRYLGKEDVAVFPANDMAGAGNADRQGVILAADLADGEDVEQLRVQRSSVELEDQVRDPGSQRLSVHDATFGLLLGKAYPRQFPGL